MGEPTIGTRDTSGRLRRGRGVGVGCDARTGRLRLEEADLPGAGFNINRTLFCETAEGRGYIARVCSSVVCVYQRV